MKKFLVFIRRSNPKSLPASWEFDTADEVTTFLVNEDPRNVSIFLQAENVDLDSGAYKLARQLNDMALDTNTLI